VSVLRLAARRRAPEAWSIATEAIIRLRNADPNDEVACHNAEHSLTGFLTRMRGRMSESPPNAELAGQFADQLLSFLDLTALAQTYVEYGTGDLLSIAAEAFRLHLAASAANAADWNDCLDILEGINQVPLMTVHKSKGLEYDTVLFMGLDDRMWWSHSAG